MHYHSDPDHPRVVPGSLPHSTLSPYQGLQTGQYLAMHAISSGCSPLSQRQRTSRCCWVANHHQQLQQQQIRAAAASSRNPQQPAAKSQQCVTLSDSQHSSCVGQHSDVQTPTSNFPPDTPVHTQHTSGCSSSSSSTSRRGLLLRSTLLPALLLVGSDDATTIVNSILSGPAHPCSIERV